MKLFSSKVMSGIFVCLTFFSFSCSVKEKAEVKDYVSYVDPYIGSGAHGHVFVGANVPFGAFRLVRRIFIRAGTGVRGTIIRIV